MAISLIVFIPFGKYHVSHAVICNTALIELHKTAIKNETVIEIIP